MSNLGRLPYEVGSILFNCEGWLVGSGVDWYLENQPGLPRDIDIMVPKHLLQKAARILSQHPVRINSMGGMKFTIGELEVDLFGLSIEEFIKDSGNYSRKIINFNYGIATLVSWEPKAI
jgi:hypothetical protein